MGLARSKSLNLTIANDTLYSIQYLCPFVLLGLQSGADMICHFGIVTIFLALLLLFIPYLPNQRLVVK